LELKAIAEAKQAKARQQSRAITRTVDQSLEWINKEFYIPETNEPIKLLPYQKRVIRESLRIDENGLLCYSTILYSDLKKSAKSTISAAVALCLGLYYPYETIRIVANDMKQANSRTFAYIVRAIELNPRLRDVCKINNYHIELPNKTVIDAVPVDPKGEAGGGDLITCFTELWGYKNEASKKMWVETALSPLKFGQSLRWCESYAGYTGDSPILEQLYETGVIQGQRIDDDLELYTNGRQLTFWNTTPRCPWQTDDFYAYESTQYTSNEFNRIHRNQWVSSLDVFIPPEWWEACKVESLPALTANEPMVLALDAAESDDCFGIVLLSKHGDKVAIRYVRKWKPKKGHKIIYVNENDPDDVDYPEGEIRRLIREKNICEVAYDRFQLHDMSNRLRTKIGVNCYSFKQGEERLVADKQLYDLIKERRIMHSGESDLKEHIVNAYQKSDGGKMRIVKGADPNRKIDLAVCLSMATHRAFKLNL
jgi:phage terminase large subunit-like protein